MYSEFPNPILVLDTTLEGMFWFPFSCRYKMTRSQPAPPTSISVVCITWCWEMHPLFVPCKAKSQPSWPPKSGKTFSACSLKWVYPRNDKQTFLHSQSCSLSLALLALAVTEKIQALWERQEKNAQWKQPMSCEHCICLSLLSGWEECRGDKILARCLFKIQAPEPKSGTALLHLTQF